jgi:hypothetical protein
MARSLTFIDPSFNSEPFDFATFDPEEHEWRREDAVAESRNYYGMCCVYSCGAEALGLSGRCSDHSA